MFKEIYIDGPDLTGKTTLINKLNKIYNYNHYIADRSIMSCYIYNKLYKRNEVQNNIIYNKLLELPADNLIFVITHDSMETLNERYNVRGDELQTVDSIIKINNLYKELLNDANIKSKNNIIHLTVSQVLNFTNEEWVNLI